MSVTSAIRDRLRYTAAYDVARRYRDAREHRAWERAGRPVPPPYVVKQRVMSHARTLQNGMLLHFLACDRRRALAYAARRLRVRPVLVRTYAILLVGLVGCRSWASLRAAWIRRRAGAGTSSVPEAPALAGDRDG